MWVPSLGREDPLEEGMATYSNILDWRIPWTEEIGGLQSIESQRVGHNWRYLACTHTDKWDLIKLFVQQKKPSTKQRQPTKCEKTFANDVTHKRLLSKIYKELNIKKRSKNGQKTWTDISPKNTQRWPIGTWKDSQQC